MENKRRGRVFGGDLCYLYPGIIPLASKGVHEPRVSDVRGGTTLLCYLAAAELICFENLHQEFDIGDYLQCLSDFYYEM